MANEKKKVVKIDGKDYPIDTLSKKAQSQVVNLQVTDAEIEGLKRKLAIYQTARVAYATALKAELPKH